MKKLTRVLGMLIAMAAIALLVVGVDKGSGYFEKRITKRNGLKNTVRIMQMQQTGVLKFRKSDSGRTYRCGNHTYDADGGREHGCIADMKSIATRN